MTPGFPEDSTLMRLRALPRVDLTRESAASIRAHAHTALAKRRQADQVSRQFRARIVDGAFVVVSVVYLSSAVAQAWRLFSGLR
jgi:hypothetical protein